MSNEKTKRPDANEDLQKSSIINNPCGICRAAGMSICKGHGGGSGGGSEDSKNDEKVGDKTKAGLVLLNVPTPKPKNDAFFNSLEQSQLWTHTDDFIFQYKNPNALLTITLNMENNRLICQGRADLTEEEQYALDTLFTALEHELNLLKNESSSAQPMQVNISRLGNQMTINIPNPKYFDAFIQRLVDKNLLVLAEDNSLQAQPKLDQRVAKSISGIEVPKSDQSASSWTAPTPFNLTPKPKD